MEKIRNNSILIVFIFLIIFGCNSSKERRFYSFIENNCSFENSDTAYIDLKDYFKVNFDTMYVFGEYTQLEGVRLILGIKNYRSKNAMMPKGFLVEDSHNKIILLKNHKIVFDEDIKSPYFYDDGIEVKKVGIFDGEAFTNYAKIFTTSKFMVIKKKNGNENYYIYRNVLSDGSLVPYETIK